MNKIENCQACAGRGWLIVDIDGDSRHAWVQRCDECQYFGKDDPRTKWDDDLAPLAAAYYGTTVGHAIPSGDHDCDHEHVYLKDTPHFSQMLRKEKEAAGDSLSQASREGS